MRRPTTTRRTRPRTPAARSSTRARRPLDASAPSAPDCVAPALVETVSIDPDGAGPLPLGVYTHVRWTGLGHVRARRGTRRSSTSPRSRSARTRSTWTGATPTPASGDQAANLDNNSGAETADEQALTNLRARRGQLRPRRHRRQRRRHAHAHRRGHRDPEVGRLRRRSPRAQISHWTLDIETSEYRRVDDIVVTDTLPDGLCPLGPVNYENATDQQAECDPEPGESPTSPYTLGRRAAGRHVR